MIVGGGRAWQASRGMAYTLQKRGYHDFVLLEMEQQPGGNSLGVKTKSPAYPWAAHYLPIPGPKTTLVRELCEELGLLKDGRWEERNLCFSPQERLYIHGRWQEGLEPDLLSRSPDREEFRRFQDKVNQFRASGEFTIPIQRLGLGHRRSIPSPCSSGWPTTASGRSTSIGTSTMPAVTTTALWHGTPRLGRESITMLRASPMTRVH